jgi:amidase
MSTTSVVFLISILSASLAFAQAPREPSSPATATITQLNESFAAGTLTSEELVLQLGARMDAYDDAGPHLNALLARNPKALDQARALDAERKVKGPRGPLHGIPVVLKDNIDTADLPTTGGSVLLEGSLPPDDSFVTRRLREAGAIVLAKTNLSEFALGSAFSSLGGQMRNPHDLARTPAGSSGGTAVAVAAAYAPLGLGTDTGGSIRAPAFATGIVGLKPTHGLISRDGIIPLALTLDTVGPMARSVADVAMALDVLAGSDPADPATRRSAGRPGKGYLRSLDGGALKGARIGVARDFMGFDGATDWVVESALAAMRAQGATVVDVRFPEWLTGDVAQYYYTVVDAEFAAQLPAYLATLAPRYPKTLSDLLSRAEAFRVPRDDGAVPNPGRWAGIRRQMEGPGTEDYRYLAVRDHALPLMTAILEGTFVAGRLDVIVYPTWERTAGLIEGGGASGKGRPFVECITNLAGLPELVVPAGFTAQAMPVGLSFLGKRFDEARLLSLGHGFEQATRALRLPAHTPELGAVRSR